nr:MAG TPA: hypothetical protein [Caudoviricetes sp.]
MIFACTQPCKFCCPDTESTNWVMRRTPRGIVICTERNTTRNIRSPVCLRRAKRGSRTTLSTEKQSLPTKRKKHGIHHH